MTDTTRQLGAAGFRGPLGIEDIDSPGHRYDAMVYVELFGFAGLSVRRGTDGQVRAYYANADWQYRPKYREYVSRANEFRRT